MADDDIRFVIRGLPELQRALDALANDLVPKVEAGFMAQARYRGQQGGPHTVSQVELVGRQHGFVVKAR